jgi:hypothetical protein
MSRLLLAAVFSLVAGEVTAQETSFLLINGTAYPISQLAVSETDFNFWTPNVLHPPPIKAGERVGRGRGEHDEREAHRCAAHALTSLREGKGVHGGW